MEQTLLRTTESIQLEHEVNKYLELYNDTTTWLAETLDGSMQTTFEFAFNGTDLVSEDGRNLRVVFDDALVDVDKLIEQNPAFAFEKPRRQLERQEYDIMCGMANGELPNTMVLVTEFPEALKTATSNLGGYDVERQHDMLRVIKHQPDGSISITTQTLDNSTPGSIEAVYNELDFEVDHERSYLGQRALKDLDEESQAKLLNRLVSVYDQALAEELGGRWHAGRHENNYIDTHSFVLSQHNLVDNFVKKWLVGGVSENEKYDLAAAIEQCHKGNFSYKGSGLSLATEAARAGQAARQEGKSFSGCGLSLTAGESPSALAELGYGNTFKKMSCPFCKASVWGDPCASRIKCGGCKAEVRDGKVINKGNSKQKKTAKKLGKKAVKKTLSFWEKLFS